MHYGWRLTMLGLALWTTVGASSAAHAQGAIIDRFKASTPVVGLCSETTRTIRSTGIGGMRVEQVSEQSVSRECAVSPAGAPSGGTALRPRERCGPLWVVGAFQNLDC